LILVRARTSIAWRLVLVGIGNGVLGVPLGLWAAANAVNLVIEYHHARE